MIGKDTSLEPGYVLHRRPYRNSSLLVEAFTRQHGRIALVARGARAARHSGLCEPFRPLLLAWRGRGELYTLTTAEPSSPAHALGARALIPALYMNELLYKLLHRNEAHPGLFDSYAATLTDLTRAEKSLEPLLRRFELALLRELGYGLVLDRDVQDGQPIDPHAWYRYDLEAGPARVSQPTDDAPLTLPGRCLISLMDDTLHDTDTLRYAKRLLRRALERQLGQQPLHSRALYSAPLT